MKIGFRTSPQNTDWASLEAAWAEAGRHDAFDSGWLNDHLTDPGLDRGGPSFESMTALAALAHLVPGKTVGQTVLAATFRQAGMSGSMRRSGSICRRSATGSTGSNPPFVSCGPSSATRPATRQA